MLLSSATSYTMPVLKTLFNALKNADFYCKNSSFAIKIHRL